MSTKDENLTQLEYNKKYGNKKLEKHASLTAEERETIISWCDDDNDGKIFIHTTQMPMFRKLMKNPLFEVDRWHNDVDCEPHGVDGYLPRHCLTIRSKKRVLTEKQRQEAKKRFEKLRKQRIGA